MNRHETSEVPLALWPPVNQDGGEPIAIVGSACRFPGGTSSPSKLWDLLRQPRDVLCPIPNNRFNPTAFYHPEGTHHGTSNVTESYLLEEDPRVFDAGFFSIKPVEAHATDPQHRILLETVYEALESAGLPMETMAGSQTAVYVGQMWCDYNDHLQRDLDSLPTYAGVGTARSILSNRISHFFDWHGPSATIDTACSSSLVAVYNAVMTLRNGDSPVAVVAGANIILTPEPYVGESKLKMLSHDSRSRMWDADAKGYARGDGVAALILKPLSAALADGDHVECVIRECLVNQDGRTPEGITVPSSRAQADLIRKTYGKAGLDAAKPEDRCQFFEAHGTGTGAGDPREAEAIATAFFGPQHQSADPADKLYVGSIKTVIGHTEGTAGIAGILKASLAVQHAEIPPNLLFHRLSPSVAPFYGSLEIPTHVKKWPPLAPGAPRRASVNSFGFGGTNAHVILESFNQNAPISDNLLLESPVRCARLLSPFVFSASSEKSLRGMVRQYISYLTANPNINLRDLAFTLSRRSVLPSRVSFPAQSTDGLVARLTEWLKKADASPDRLHGVRYSGGAGRSSVLGVFTGQGAQWATMGRKLVNDFPHVRGILHDLDRSLATLPNNDSPQWSIADELDTDQGSSRVGQAAFSQPLCTAVQIVLVDLLRSAGIRFKAVVGHSSGEIAAAYAAGFITACDAIRIAYYRGRVSALAGNGRPERGAMMAIGTTLEDAQELCNVDTLQGRLFVAAVNSSSSITLSGDADAVEEARAILEDENKFARLLKVDKAYHSHHMLPCVQPYLQAMADCHVETTTDSDNTCAWFSSVRADTRVQGWELDLAGQYWCDNMAKPVLFSNAVRNAWEQEGPFDAIVEVGPHPALKGPVMQTLQDLDRKKDSPLTYTGLLSRNQDDIESFTNGLGTIWQGLSPGSVNLDNLERRVSSGSPPSRLLKGLPSYSWDHDRVYWHESRLSRAHRTRQAQPHPLLGTLLTDGVEKEMRWRNLLRVSEVPWVKGHTLQGQVVFPAAGYIVTAMEAALALAGSRPLQMLEIHHVVIGRALTLEDDVDVETLISLSNVRYGDSETAIADFEYHACLHRDASNLTLLAKASVEMTFGTTTDGTTAVPVLLPAREEEHQPNLLEVDTDDFYAFLEEVGYGYTGPFRALESMQRKLDYGTGALMIPQEQWAGPSVLMHPAFLDASFQAIFLAMGWPRDAGLVEVFVPTEFQSIKVNIPGWIAAASSTASQMRFDSRLRQFPESVTGDVEVFSPTDDGSTLIQVENIKVVPFSPDSATSTRQLYSKTSYWPVTVDGLEASGGRIPTDQELEMAWELERAAIYYLRKIEDEFLEPGSRDNLEPHHEYFFEFSHDILSRVSQGTMPYAKKEWLEDTWEVVAKIFDRYPDSLDLQLMRKVGENMAAAIKGQTNLVEILFKDDFMDRFYAGALGLDLTMDWLGRMAVQLSRRYPHMKILELGAGTGGATKSVFKHIGQQFSSYTFTDISAGFFPAATNIFTSHKMIFKTLDAERDVVEQGFEEGGYDLIIASNVLHATARLDDTLRSTRRLLKPGGYLLIAEVTCADVVRVRFPFSALPGWWRGRDDGRPLTASIDTTEWHQRLMRTGFSGIDAVTPEFAPLAWPSLVILSQAVDDRVDFLRQPLYHPPSTLSSSSHDEAAEQQQLLVLVGGQTIQSSGLLGQVSRILAPWFASTSIIRIRSLHDLAKLELPRARCTVINFADLDSPALDDLTELSFAGLKNLVEYPHSILWITSGCRQDSPKMNMSVGLGRVLIHEMPGLRLQFLDIDSLLNGGTAGLIAETFLRWRALAQYEGDAKSSGPLLWAREHELVLENDVIKVPRIVFDEDMNLRYNASRKVVTQETNVKDFPVCLRRIGSSWKFTRSAVALVGSSHAAGTLSIALASAVPCHSDLYVVLATDTETGSPVAAMSAVNGSLVTKNDAAAMVPIDAIRENWTSYLASLVIELQIASILEAVPHGSCLLLHEPSLAMVDFILARTSEKNLRVLCSSSNKVRKDQLTSGQSQLWITVEAHTPIRVVRSRLSTKIDVFVDCLEEPDPVLLPAAIQNALPQTCLRLALRDLVHRKPCHASDPAVILSEAVSRVNNRKDWMNKTTNMMMVLDTKTPEQLDLSCNLDTGLSLIIDWQSSPTSIVPAVVPSVDAYLSLKPDRTYVFFGLTSDLGQSLCDWMAAHGARHLAMTSRRPDIDPRWLAAKERAGITVRVFANDITDEKALRDVVDDIRKSMPPIAGIANGAMVLRDKPFLDMPLEMMTQTLDTKVKGSVYLDSIFGDKSRDDLDFFILFSSIAAVTGNRAQSNYSAANMFMTALANNRRARGLAASVMHIGAIMGVGYMSRNLTRAILDNLWSAGATWISEKDFHNCFAEAVLAGRPELGAGGDPEFIVGLRQLVQGRDSSDKVLVMDDPRFSHMVSRDVALDDAVLQETGARKSTSIKHSLHGAKTQKAVARIVRDGFIAKLITTLQLDTQMPEAEILASRADELGVDSLVSVNFRAWFASEMSVEMPVLKLLGGSTIEELVAFSLEKLAPGLTPNLGGSEEEDHDAEEPEPDRRDIKPVTATTPVPSVGILSPEQTVRSMPALEIPTVSPGIPTDEPVVRTSSTSESTSSLLDYQSTGSDEEGVLTASTSVKSTSSEPTSPRNDQIAKVDKSIPMSAGQSRFWFLKHFVTDKSAFNITFSAQLKGSIRVDALARAVDVVANTHEALRTSFSTQDGRPIQLILAKPRLALEHRNVRDVAEAKQIFEALKVHEYNLERGELLKFILLTISEEVHYLVIGYHHINMDGISLEVLLADVQKSYFGQTLTRPVQYSEYCIKQNQELRSGALSDEKKFWTAELASPATAVLPLLPFSKTTRRQPLEKYAHEQVQGRVSLSLTRAIQAVCRHTKTSMFHFFLATYATLLNRYLDVEDLCIGMADAGREMGTFANSIGMYLNLLPLRLGVTATQSFIDVLQQSRRKVQSALAHSRLPFDLILNAAGAERSDMHNPLFQAFLNYRPGVSEKRMFCGCEGQGEDWASGSTSYDIMLDIIENPESEAILCFVVQSSLYSKEDAQTLMNSYLALLEAFTSDPKLPVDAAPLFMANEVQRALALGKGPEHEPRWPETLLHRIDRIAAQQPSSVAVSNGFASTLTYGAMQRRVQAIAQVVLGITKGQKGGLVGVFCQPSIDSICSLLAVMWVGSTYVPLDPTLPPERLSVLVATAHPILILTHDDTADRTDELGTIPDNVPLVNVSRHDFLASQQHNSRTPIPISAKPQDTMAIHFTSGTTGTPKGVILNHGAVANVVEACTDIYRTAATTVLQQTALNFDMALWQILVALCSGGKLVVVPQDKRLDIATVSRLIRQEEVTLTIATPSEYALWLQYGADDLKRHQQWQIAVIGGEQYSVQVDNGLRSLHLPYLRLMNFYGPSEVSFVSHYLEVFPGMAAGEDPVPVGFPLYNYSAYILDPKQRPVAPGMTGEVFIGGAGICKGYLSNSILTSQKFVSDPFVQADFARSCGWTRMYRTGDRGRINSDGTLSILGRVEGDAQVKIRGVRMELEEVERAILKQSDGLLEQVVVSTRGEGENRFLVAHALLNPRRRSQYNTESNNHDQLLRQVLQNLTGLPRVMRPAIIIPVAYLPLTVHKKVDRRAVAALPIGQLQLQQRQATPPKWSRNNSEPLNSLQLDVLRIWSHALGRGPIEVSGAAADMDFFNLGGTSLQLVGVQAAIRERFRVSVSVVDLFKKSSLEAMADLIFSGPGSKSNDEREVIDWETETRLPDIVATETSSLTWRQHRSVAISVRQPPRVVVLTGATGFIGQAILRSLLAMPSIDKVHCLAVRNPLRLGALRNNAKVAVHEGDLRHASLSLDGEETVRLAQTVDLIIHNGADVSFLKPYAALRAPNVSSTKYLAVQLAAPRRVPITYISSAVVGRLLTPPLDTFAPVSVSHCAPPPHYRDAYGASKWASEVVLEKANRDLGVPVFIRRLSSVTGSGIPDSDIMGNLVSFSEKLAAVPVTDNWKGVLDFVSVERVAQAVVADVMHASRGDGVRYRHDCSEEVVPLDGDGVSRFVSQRLLGRPVTVMPMAEWIGKAKQLGMSDLVSTFLEQAEREPGVVLFQRLLKSV